MKQLEILTVTCQKKNGSVNCCLQTRKLMQTKLLIKVFSTLFTEKMFKLRIVTKPESTFLREILRLSYNELVKHLNNQTRANYLWSHDHYM